jgi:hypothetical protein
MKLLPGLFLISLAAVLLACGPTVPSQPLPTWTMVPELNVTRIRPTHALATLPASTATLVPATDIPTASITPSEIPETMLPTLTSTSTSTLTPTRTLRPRPTPSATSAGPLSAVIYVANCNLAPTPGKPGNVNVKLSIEAAGGNGVYHYFFQGIESPGKFIDILWEKGTRMIGKVTVTSGDGQQINKTYDIDLKELICQ